MKHLFQRISNKVFLSALWLVYTTGFSQSANDIVGKWQNADDASFEVEIYLAKNGYYYGKILNDKKSAENKGKIVLQELKFDDVQKIFTGSMMPPDATITLNAEIGFIDSNKIKLKVSKFIMSKTMYLIKIK